MRLIGIIFCLWLIGCGLFYKNKYEAPGIRIYSNQDVQFIQSVGDKCSRIRYEYQSLFRLSSKDIGTMNIILSGNNQSNDLTIGTLGFYISEFNYINIATNSEKVRQEPLLTEVLSHEISHHFLMTDYPGIADKVWLNEGLAGALEVTQFEGWQFKYCLFNPVLFQVIQNKPKADLYKKVISLSWSEFHSNETKELNYATAWSIVYYILEYGFDSNILLGDRIKALYVLGTDELMKYESGWESTMFIQSITK
jgi:hypothetical protein